MKTIFKISFVFSLVLPGALFSCNNKINKDNEDRYKNKENIEKDKTDYGDTINYDEEQLDSIGLKTDSV